VLETAISTDVALVHAQMGDRHGNLVFHRSARNFSPLAAMAGHVNFKTVIVVDADVDIFDPADVMWALSTRARWDTGISTISGA